MQNNETGVLSYVIHRNKLKMNLSLKCENSTINILKENIDRKLLDISLSNIVFNVSSGKGNKSQKMSLHQTKKLSRVKEMFNKTERQTAEWEKTFANDITNKRLISKIYKELTQLNIKTNR